jgi:hypothetical protein
MPPDQDVNAAISALHFGTTLPYWDYAVRLQLARLEPQQERVVQAVAAAKRIDKGKEIAGDKELLIDLHNVVEERFKRGEGPFLYDAQIKIDGAFLLLAIRAVLAMADRILLQLETLGKHAEIAEARDRFTASLGIVKHLRDALIHYDEYVVGKGRRRDLIIDPNEGAGVTEDEDGYLLFTWGGNRVQLIEAAHAALILSETLTKMFWQPVHEP